MIRICFLMILIVNVPLLDSHKEDHDHHHKKHPHHPNRHHHHHHHGHHNNHHDRKRFIEEHNHHHGHNHGHNRHNHGHDHHHHVPNHFMGHQEPTHHHNDGHNHHQNNIHHHHHNHKENMNKKSKRYENEKLKNFDPLNYLKRHGYGFGRPERESLLNQPKSMSKSLQKNDNFINIIKTFQRLHRLKVTGSLDNDTVVKMQSPRCGMPDIILSNNKRRLKRQTQGKDTIWDKNQIRYQLLNSSEELKTEGSREAIAKAFSYWEKVTHLKFVEVPKGKPSEMVLSFEQGDHKDGYPFDGHSGELAHAFFPRDGRIHFDEAEYFTENTTEGVNLRILACHEIGHAIGLDHNFEKSSIMYPYYNGYVGNFSISDYDKLLIKELYNLTDEDLKKHTSTATTTTTIKPTTTPKTTTTTTTKAKSTTKPGRPGATTTTTITTQTPTKRTTLNVVFKNNNETFKSSTKYPPCYKPIQAMIKSPKNTLYVLIDNFDLWEYEQKTKQWTKHHLNTIYPSLEKGVRGGVQCANNYTWFFKGQTIWAFNGYKQLPGFPISMDHNRVFPKFIYTAVNKKGEFYIMRGGSLFLFDTTILDLVYDWPETINDLFPGIPHWIEATYTDNQYYYFFKDIWVYRYNIKTGKVEPNDPKLRSEVFSPCKDS